MNIPKHKKSGEYRVMKSVINLIVIMFLIFSSTFAKTIDVDEFLSLVRENSKDLKLAEKEFEMAQANKKEAYSTALPKIFSQGSYTRAIVPHYMYMDFDMPSIPGVPPMEFPDKMKASYNNQFGFSARLEQTLFSPLVGNAITAAKQYEKMTDKIYSTSLRFVMTASKKVFYQALLLKKVHDINIKAEQNAKENYGLVKTKFKAGTVSELALYQAEVNWKSKIPEITKSLKNYKLLLNSMKELAGIPFEDELNLKGDMVTYPELPEIPELESVLKMRPDYSAQEWQGKLLGTNVKAQFSGYLPSLSGNLTYAYSSMSDNWKMERENNDIMVGISLNIPIWTGGYTGAQVQKAQVNYDKAQIELEKTREKIQKELQDIYLKLKESKDRIQFSQSILSTAKKGYKIAETSVENGLATQLELKDAHLLYSQAELGYYAAILDYLMAYFDYEQAIGKK